MSSAAWACTSVLPARRELTNDTLLVAALLLACGLPLVLPQMNARCLYLAGMLAFACAGNARRTLAAVLLEMTSLCCYMQSIFNHQIIPMIVLSLVAIAAAVLVLSELLVLVCTREEKKELEA